MQVEPSQCTQNGRDDGELETDCILLDVLKPVQTAEQTCHADHKEDGGCENLADERIGNADPFQQEG